MLRWKHYLSFLEGHLVWPCSFHACTCTGVQAYCGKILLGDSVLVEVNTAGRQHCGQVTVRLSDEQGFPCSLAEWLCSSARAALSRSILHLPRQDTCGHAWLDEPFCMKVGTRCLQGGVSGGCMRETEIL